MTLRFLGLRIVLAPCHPLYLGIKIDEADGTAQSQERYVKLRPEKWIAISGSPNVEKMLK
ncbi:MAG: hypothetical protein Q8P40_04195 [Nitrospirota bacterium]|nr:hypothetical protein [Nitrospirota bacterium]